MSNWFLARRRPVLEARARITQAIRDHFTAEGFLEVETPLRIPAPAPEPHIDAVASGDWFLQTSPELCLKRLLAAGYPKIFQISRCWRAGERGSSHLPEFTMLEWYRTDADYSLLMADCEELLRSVAAIRGRFAITYRGAEVNLIGPWERLTVREAFLRYGGMEMEEALKRDCFDEIMVETIEPCLGSPVPTFLCDYPLERGALARRKPAEPSVVERFELYLAGLELANGFSELTDPEEQRQRFLTAAQERRAAGCLPYPLPEPFLSDLAQLPASAGIALGIDRLVMVLLDIQVIDEVVAFTPEEL